MVIKYVKYSLGVILLIVVGIFIYWYYNPSVENEDFHLEYEISNYKTNFYNERNTNIDEKKYTYNDELYYNSKGRYELILHSLDYTEKGERIIIVVDYLNKKNRIANITYKNKSSGFLPISIIHKKDSVFIVQKTENISVGTNDSFKSNYIIFEGKKNHSTDSQSTP